MFIRPTKATGSLLRGCRSRRLEGRNLKLWTISAEKSCVRMSNVKGRVAQLTVPEGLHDLSLARSAWKTLTAMAHPQTVRFHPFEKDIRKENTSGSPIIPSLTGRGFSYECSRHFVPGYDHSVPPGHLIEQRVLNIGRNEKNKGRVLNDAPRLLGLPIQSPGVNP
jgi:hypothetical protein